MKNTKDIRWTPHRIVLYNFWYYRNEEFYFQDGRLLLRGHNGSGKSITMQTLFTFLLDGNKDPKRLDPFGSAARKLYEILLGEESVNRDVEERIGYVFIEYKKGNKEQFLTTGFGLRAKRKNKRLEDAWGFIIHDRFRRVGKGQNPIKLYKNEVIDGKTEQIPLDRREFSTQLSDNGQVVNENEYAEIVNKHLYRFPDVSGLHLLTDVVAKLKSPKLSKESGPKVLKEVLNESLPPITDKEIAPLINTVESMDIIEKNIAKHEGDLAATEKLVKGYEDYSKYVFAEKAKYYLETEKKHKALLKKREDLDNDTRDKVKEREEKQQRIQQIDNEMEVLQLEKEEYNQGEISQLEERFHKSKFQLVQRKKEGAEKEDWINAKKRTHRHILDKLDIAEMEIKASQKNMEESMSDLESYADEVSFAENHHSSFSHFKNYEMTQPYSFIHWESQAKEFLQRLRVLRNQIVIYEKKHEQEKEIKSEIEGKQALLDEERRKEKKLSSEYDEARDESYIELNVWFESLRDFVVDPTTKSRVQRLLNGYLEAVTEEELKKPIVIERDSLIDGLRMELALTNHHMQSCVAKKTELASELSGLETNTEIEPDISTDKQSQLQYLKDNNIPYVPFYAAVEFIEGLGEELKSRLESAITEIGMITANIVPDPYIKQVSDKTIVLSRNSKQPSNVSHYFTPVPSNGVSTEDITAVLEGIGIDMDQEVYLHETGAFQSPFTRGFASNHGEAKYIGKIARELLRLRKMEAIRFEISMIALEIDRLEAEQERLGEKERTILSEYHTFPDFRELKEAKDLFIKTMTYISSILQPDLDVRNDRYKELRNEVERLKHKLNSDIDSISLPLTEQAFTEACDVMNDYLKCLGKVGEEYRSLISTQSLLRDYLENKENLEFDIDSGKGEMNVLEGEINKLDLRIVSIQKRLEEMNAEEIRKRIREIGDKLDALPKEKTVHSNDVAVLSNKIEEARNLFPGIIKEIDYYHELLITWLFVFEQDANELGSLIGLDASLVIKEKAKYVFDNFSTLLEKKDRAKVVSDLGNLFSNANMSLVEYDMSKEPIPFSKTFSDVQEHEQANIEILKAVAQKEKITLEYDSRRVSPFYLRDKLMESLQNQRNILSDKDRELFEDIMINSIGEMIKKKIRNAKDWVEKINVFMESANNSSGLKFEIKWNPIKADPKKEDLGTEKLMQLIERETALLPDEDKERISQHFRSKVNEAKRRMEIDGLTTFVDVIKEVLDYRNWYEFVVWYERTGETRKEMRTGNFNSFSGGEKALAMYTPLLAAVDARLQSSCEEAPRMFALDEAFAGVDDKNIEETFKVIEMFDFDYTLNSQALWGCYSEVPNLSIYELYRPLNANLVMTTRYIWNGVKLTRLASDYEVDAQAEVASGSQITML
jgi:uncharacterized protein (TIGR02680 family)